MNGGQRDTTILGAGYTGAALLRRFPRAAATHRAARDGAFAFTLEDEASWRNPPLAGRHVVWTFPAAPLPLVQAFHEACLRDAANLIVFGSTSGYLLEDDAGIPLLDEDAALDLRLPRVQGEEWLRARGATVLRLAGIFGPGREPADWLRRGLIRDGARLVNLIQVEDIVALVARLFEHPAPGAHINVAGGEALAWRDLAARLQERGELSPDWSFPETGAAAVHGKRIDNRRLRGLLPGHVFRQP